MSAYRTLDYYLFMIFRVHWLIWNLNQDFKKNYHITFDYAYHNYSFTRFNGRRLIDCFIVTRTSKKCFRVSYCNYLSNDILYFSCYKSKHVANRMYYIFKYHQGRGE